jgi:hypothetical protein
MTRVTSFTQRNKDEMMNWKHQGMRWALSVCLMIGLALAIVPASYAQTADGETPAEEDICTTWGMTGKVNGLCNSYCEAMDCDSAAPQASEQACSRVLGKIEGALGDTPFPTCQDVDGDGVPNGLDNCPDTANPDQADDNTATPEGKACEPITCPCLGTWEDGVAAPSITTHDFTSPQFYGESDSITQRWGCESNTDPLSAWTLTQPDYDWRGDTYSKCSDRSMGTINSPQSITLSPAMSGAEFQACVAVLQAECQVSP